MPIERAIAYIDGYNLYYGLVEAGLKSSRWLDLPRLCESFTRSDQHLELTRYFTTPVRNDHSATRRQTTFLDALKARGGIDIRYGHFLSQPVKCYSCGNQWQKSEEKKTDVNIAVAMLEDAQDDLFDVAFLVSGDSDLVPPVEAVLSRYPRKQVVVAFPPKRESVELRKTATTAFIISDQQIRQARLPEDITTTEGVVLSAPSGWLPST